VHGRLYVTQNFVCFYANIFGWETQLVLRCAEVLQVRKEKTAFVVSCDSSVLHILMDTVSKRDPDHD
jgi:hypothetical protein